MENIFEFLPDNTSKLTGPPTVLGETKTNHIRTRRFSIVLITNIVFELSNSSIVTIRPRPSLIYTIAPRGSFCSKN